MQKLQHGYSNQKKELDGAPKTYPGTWLINSASLKSESDGSRKTGMKILDRAMNKTDTPAIFTDTFGTSEHQICL